MCQYVRPTGSAPSPKSPSIGWVVWIVSQKSVEDIIGDPLWVPAVHEGRSTGGIDSGGSEHCTPFLLAELQDQLSNSLVAAVTRDERHASKPAFFQELGRKLRDKHTVDTRRPREHACVLGRAHHLLTGRDDEVGVHGLETFPRGHVLTKVGSVRRKAPGVLCSHVLGTGPVDGGRREG